MRDFVRVIAIVIVCIHIRIPNTTVTFIICTSIVIIVTPIIASSEL